MADQGRMGRKAKAGFYAYDEARASGWACGRGWRHGYPAADDQPDLTEVQHRLMLAQVLEAVRALEEGVLTDIREGDVGAILGWGFAPWSGGPFGWLDRIGASGRAWLAVPRP
jgi:3-hydroxyacyl-CoA dehydrogenase / enoyl-CoA hydratase / 3-hydroxybutyryl-CoA epimerase